MPLLIGSLAVLLPLAVILAAALTLPACALILPLGLGALGNCASQAKLSDPGPRDDEIRIAQLESEVALLLRDLARVECQPTAMPYLPPAEAASLPPPVEELVLADDLTEEDFDRGDVAILEGCWELDSDYRTVDARTGAVSLYDLWSICFDGNGRGVERMRDQTGNACVGPVTGEFTERGLNITEPGDLSCSDGSVIFRREMECSLDDQGLAQCSVRQPERNTTSAARLRRSAGEE